MPFDITDVEKHTLFSTVNRLKRIWEWSRSEMLTDHNMYERRYKGLVQVPSWCPIYESSTSARIVNTLSDQIRTGQPVVAFKPRGNSQAARSQQTLMERWGSSVMEALTQRAEIDPFRQGVMDKLLRGMSVYKVEIREDKLKDAPDRKKYEDEAAYTKALIAWRGGTVGYDLFDVRSIDPLNIFAPPDLPFPLPWILEYHERTLADMYRDYPDWEDPVAAEMPEDDPAKYDPNRIVRYIQGWTPEWYILEANGRTIKKIRNPLGVVPYVISYSGLGRNNYDGDPRSMAVSVLRPIRGELIEEVRLKTAMAAQWQLHVFPRMITMEDPKQVAKLWDMSPGGILQLTNPVLPPKWMDVPPPNEQMGRWLQEIKSAIESTGRPVLEGQRPTGVDFGYQQAMLIGQARLELDTIKKTLDADGTKVLNLLARMMTILDVKMTVNAKPGTAEKGRTVAGKDFTDYNFEVSFESVTPQENDRLIFTGLAMRRAGDISRRTFLKKFAKGFIEDPDEEEDQIMYEKAVDQYIAGGGLTNVLGHEDQVRQQQENVAKTRQRLTQQLQKGAMPQPPGINTQKTLGPLGGTEPMQTNAPTAATIGG